ncbi:MAG TPA: DUF488 domain-containing protein [Candidatus Acidoferrum sp.]|nr:DUF488 domain-containing protein [Candidatus Acidoferrum sp.]
MMSKPDIRLKRAYDPPAPADGRRILVERLWPRGLTRERAKIDHWCKEVAPSSELRRWFAHDPARWPEFRRRYRAELKGNAEEVARLADLCAGRRVTFVFAARDEAMNSAVVLREYLRGP